MRPSPLASSVRSWPWRRPGVAVVLAGSAPTRRGDAQQLEAPKQRTVFESVSWYGE